MRDKNKAKTVKLRGPNGTTKEISLEEWNSYTPLNALANHTADSYARVKALTTKP